jgi:hypothetical protein
MGKDWITRMIDKNLEILKLGMKMNLYNNILLISIDNNDETNICNYLSQLLYCWFQYWELTE